MSLNVFCCCESYLTTNCNVLDTFYFIIHCYMELLTFKLFDKILAKNFFVEKISLIRFTLLNVWENSRSFAISSCAVSDLIVLSEEIRYKVQNIVTLYYT